VGAESVAGAVLYVSEKAFSSTAVGPAATSGNQIADGDEPGLTVAPLTASYWLARLALTVAFSLNE
jgi:hypothetical protein